MTVWFRRQIRRPDKGLFAAWRVDPGSGRMAFGRVTYDPPLRVGPGIRHRYKRCARKRQRAEDRRACRSALLDP